MDQHVLSVVAKNDGWLVFAETLVNASVTTRAIRVIAHQIFGDIFPVATLRYVFVTLNDVGRIVCHEMVVAASLTISHHSGVAAAGLAWVWEMVFARPILEAWQVGDGLTDSCAPTCGRFRHLHRYPMKRGNEKEPRANLRHAEVRGAKDARAACVARFSELLDDGVVEQTVLGLDNATDVLKDDPIRLPEANDPDELPEQPVRGIV